MIDHLMGRPSTKFRKIQVFGVVSFWTVYLLKADRHGPPILRRISSLLSRKLTAWQTLVITLLWLYVARNFGKVFGLECPEPLANLYNRSYFRATWVTTALDAGFWTAMRIRKKWLRDICSLIFSAYYLICAEQADEKVRKVRATLTLEHLRVSWEKGTTPVLSYFVNKLRPVKIKYPPRPIRIRRPRGSAYQEPIEGWLYFDGPREELLHYDELILDVPGGGFVAMNPRDHDDKLIGWAKKTGRPVLSLNYRKAPEYPYPYALNECFDAYKSIIANRGKSVYFSGEVMPKMIVSGDSAGANLAVGMILMVLETRLPESRLDPGEKPLPPPVGVILIYPALDMNIGNWMTDEQMSLIRDRRVRNTNRSILRRKSDDFRKLAPETPHVSDDEDDGTPPSSEPLPTSSQEDSRRRSIAAMTPTASASLVRSPSTAIHLSAAHTNTSKEIQDDSASTLVNNVHIAKPQQLRTRVAMSSMISYFNDRILTPEMMRAMIILYIGPHNRPDFSTDFLLSPVLAPESLLAEFPMTYFLTGERDPLVDDTVIFAGRLRQAKRAQLLHQKELGVVPEKTEFRDRDHVEVALVPGISHGFIQFVSLFPEGWKEIYRCSGWMNLIFGRIKEREFREKREQGRASKPATKKESREGDYFTNGYSMTSAATTAESTPAASVEPKALSETRYRQDSSGDEGGLEMPPLRPLTKRSASPGIGGRKRGRGDPNGRGVPISGNTSPDSVKRGSGHATKGRGSRPKVGERQPSVVGLEKSEDVFARRMKNFTVGLQMSHPDDAPPTP